MLLGRYESLKIVCIDLDLVNCVGRYTLIDRFAMVLGLMETGIGVVVDWIVFSKLRDPRRIDCDSFVNTLITADL